MSLPLVVTISASPVSESRTQLLAAEVAAAVGARGFAVEAVNVRDLPAEDLLWGRTDAPPIRRALDLVERAEGVVVATPVYKAAYTGVLKTFLDLLPQLGLADKVVLPLVTGGTIAHVLTIDYALRPVLLSLGAQHVVAGLFILDKLLERRPTGGLVIGGEIAGRLDAVVVDFVSSLDRRRSAGRPSLPGLSPAAAAV